MKRFAYLIIPAIIFGIFIYFATKEPAPTNADTKRRNDSLKMVKKQEEFEKAARERAQARSQANATQDESNDSEVLVERMPEPIPFDKQTFKEQLELKKIPSVKNLRKALNDLSKGKWATKYVEDGLQDMIDFGTDKNGNPVRIDYSKFNSKIMILSFSEGVMGGYEIIFYFVHNNRQFFNAWMYPLAGRESNNVLRGLSISSLSETDIDNALFNMSQYLDKPELAF
jgi:hypothetical protein